MRPALREAGPPGSAPLASNMHGRADGPAAARIFPKSTGRSAGSCMKARGMADEEKWVVWNGSMGILDMATIGHVEVGEDGRRAYLAPPYGVVGAFSLDELETRGRIAFGECLVMSRQRWQEDQVDLRLAARARRRAFLSFPNFDADGDLERRKALNLPPEGALAPAEINAAFRRLAKSAHPDAGGDDEAYRRIAEARDALLEQFAGAS